MEPAWKTLLLVTAPAGVPAEERSPASPLHAHCPVAGGGAGQSRAVSGIRDPASQACSPKDQPLHLNKTCVTCPRTPGSAGLAVSAGRTSVHLPPPLEGAQSEAGIAGCVLPLCTTLLNSFVEN